MKLKVEKEIFVGGFVLMIAVVNGQRRGYLFGKQDPYGVDPVQLGERNFLYWPRQFNSLPKEIGWPLFQKELDVCMQWSADDQVFGPWKPSDFEFPTQG